MNFEEAFPETKVAAPLMPGEMPQTASPLYSLRLAQLRDLARAYDLKIDLDASKPAIMPAMLQAEQSGIFRTPAKHQAWMQRAMVDPDSRVRLLDPATQMGMTSEEHQLYHDERRKLRGGRPKKDHGHESLEAAEG